MQGRKWATKCIEVVPRTLGAWMGQGQFTNSMAYYGHAYLNE